MQMNYSYLPKLTVISLTFEDDIVTVVVQTCCYKSCFNKINCTLLTSLDHTEHSGCLSDCGAAQG